MRKRIWKPEGLNTKSFRVITANIFPSEQEKEPRTRKYQHSTCYANRSSKKEKSVLSPVSGKR